MIRIRRAPDRGHFDHGWLDTRHTFSFADYYDPAHLGFRALRVMNEDRVQPGQGFGTHGHRDMEIVSYVLEGALAHRDSMGNGSVLRPGEFQRMTAGTGIRHSEFNPSDSEPAHFYQIWLLPAHKGLTPSYEQRRFPAEEMQGQWRLVASSLGQEEALTINQDADIYLAHLQPNQVLRHELATGRHAWLQLLRGAAKLNGEPMEEGDGAAVSDETTLATQATQLSEVMLFDLA